jgi:hypothetical protein
MPDLETDVEKKKEEIIIRLPHLIKPGENIAGSISIPYDDGTRRERKIDGILVVPIYKDAIQHGFVLGNPDNLKVLLAAYWVGLQEDNIYSNIFDELIKLANLTAEKNSEKLH